MSLLPPLAASFSSGRLRVGLLAKRACNLCSKLERERPPEKERSVDCCAPHHPLFSVVLREQKSHAKERFSVAAALEVQVELHSQSGALYIFTFQELCTVDYSPSSIIMLI